MNSYQYQSRTIKEQQLSTLEENLDHGLKPLTQALLLDLREPLGQIKINQLFKWQLLCSAAHSLDTDTDMSLQCLIEVLKQSNKTPLSIMSMLSIIISLTLVSSESLLLGQDLIQES